MRSFAALAGGRLEYELWPAPDGAPTLVFLHQGLGSLSLWRDVPARLAAATGCGALASSRLGHGGSDPEPLPRPLDYLVREGETTLPALLAALAVRRPILVGHSDGGTIALAYLAAGHPALAAIVVAPHVFDEEMTWREIARVRALWPGELRARLARHHRDPDATFGAWAEFWLSPAFRGWSMLERLGPISCPILAVQGRRDPYGSMRQIEEIAARAAGPVTLAPLDERGHDPFREDAAQMVALCADFVAQAMQS